MINWANIGVLYNVEAGCYTTSKAQSQPKQPDSSFIHFNGNGCIKFAPKSSGDTSIETLELLFKTQSDQAVLLYSSGSEFLIHTQGPALVIRNKDDSLSKVIAERGVAFNDGEWHKLKLDKSGELKIDVELDGRYKQEFPLTRRNKLTPLHVGCTRLDEKLKFKLNELKSWRGRVQNVVYGNGGGNKVDLGEKLNLGDGVVLVEGVVQWSVAGKNGGQRPPEGAVGFKENSFLKLDKINFDQNSNISFSFKVKKIKIYFYDYLGGFKEIYF